MAESKHQCHCTTETFDRHTEISFPHRAYWIYQYVNNVRNSGCGFLMLILSCPAVQSGRGTELEIYHKRVI